MKKKKTISEMNVKELKQFISKETKKANTILRRVAKKKKVKAAVQEEINILKRKGIIGKSGKAIKGFRGKKKEELRAQARELEYFTQWKGTETQEVRDEVNYAKYKSFIENVNNSDFKNYSYQEWRDMVETFGSTASIIDSFYYENIKELHKEVTAGSKNVNLAAAMREVLRANKGAGLSKEDAIDLLRKELFS